MFCPKCRSEYIDGVTQCDDCNEQLVESRPEEEPKTYEYVDMVTVLIPRDMGEIAFVKSLLDEARIRYFAKNENMGNLFGTIGGGIFNVEIQVSKTDEDEAREILKQIL